MEFKNVVKSILTVYFLGLFQTNLIATEISTATVTGSTDTLEGTLDSIAEDMAEIAKDITWVVPVEIPVEHKVVELKITPPTMFIISDINRKKKGKQTLPFPNQATCSGAFVTDSGDILTAKHCTDIGSEIEVRTHDNRTYQATIVSTSPMHDLALIHIDLRNSPHFDLADKVERGQRINILGSPLAITDVLAVGVVARVAGDSILVDCSALPGNSGGPVFDDNGELVGILTSGYTYGMGVTHLNSAQGLDAISFFLKGAFKKLPWLDTK